jgi:hypothetical protein
MRGAYLTNNALRNGYIDKRFLLKQKDHRESLIVLRRQAPSLK